jgi:hypothetical protein
MERVLARLHVARLARARRGGRRGPGRLAADGDHLAGNAVSGAVDGGGEAELAAGVDRAGDLERVGGWLLCCEDRGRVDGRVLRDLAVLLAVSTLSELRPA